MKGNISGVILFDETIGQKAKDGIFSEYNFRSRALPGIKVDKGHKILDSEESLTQGNEGLNED